MTKSSLHNNFLLPHFEAMNFTFLLPNYIIKNYNVPSFERKMKEHDLKIFQKQDGGFFRMCFIVQIPSITPTL